MGRYASHLLLAFKKGAGCLCTLHMEIYLPL
nr:MAG TPA: hypothetical protein [Bacteriophage sp.]